MKKNIFLLFILGIVCSFNVASQNLIQGGSMEAADRSAWTTASFTKNVTTEQWGEATDVPANGSGGALHLAGTSTADPGADVQYAIYQAVELQAGVTYQADAAYNVIGAITNSWVEFYIGSVDPATAADYAAGKNDDILQVFSLLSWNVQPSVLNGTLLNNANTKRSVFTPAKAGTYYFLIKVGCNSATGKFDVLLDGVSLKPIGHNILQNPTLTNGPTGWNVKNYTTNVNLTWISDNTATTWDDADADILRATAASGSGSSCLYQQVQLYAGINYYINLSYNVLKSNQAWVETYVGTNSPETTGSDYTAANCGGQQVSPNVLSWASAPENTIRRAGIHYASFTVPTTGTYYIAIKIGANASVDVMLDNITLGQSETPKALFNPKVTDTGSAPFNVEFVNTSTFCTSYAWNFGDGQTSTEENPTHTYNKAGIYTVTLIANGDEAITYAKKIYVTTGENLLKDGNMEAATGWTVTHMDYAVGQPEATMDWNNTENVPQFGEGGALKVSSGSYRVIIGLSQPVELKAGKSYKFNMALKIPAGSNSFWAEAYFLKDVTPVAGQKLGLGLGEGSKEYVKETVPATPATQIGGHCSGFLNQDGNYNGNFPVGWDVMFSNVGFLELNSSAAKQPSKVNVGVFTPEEDGVYNFILKIGGTSGVNVVFDELSVKALFETAPENIIKGGNMEVSDRAYWTELGETSFSTDKNTQLVWGDVPNGDRPQGYKPAGFETDGFLTVAEGWSGATQYCIYQEVTLDAKAYTISFDRHIGDYSRAWFEVYVGKTKPTDADYKDNKIGVSCIPWTTGNATGSNGVFNENFTIDEAGTYYVVIKWGCGGGGNGYFNTSLDNVLLTVAPPTAAFDLKNSYTMGFAEIPVVFKNQSANATSYAWDFGNGTTSAEKNPEAVTYATAGEYTVTLTIDGDEATKVSKVITILPAPGNNPERIVGGNLDNKNDWFTTTYVQNPAATPAFSLNWNYSQIDNPVNFPTGGSGNALVIKDDAGNVGVNNTTRFTYVYQPVYLTAGKTYQFDMAARSVRMANTGTLWVEAFVIQEQAFEGKALSVTNVNSIAYYNGAAPGYDTPATTWDAVFSTDTRIIKGASYPFNKCVFIPEETGIYFCIVRVGTTNKIEVAIDNISLKEVVMNPVASFSNEFSVGVAPFSVAFENTSQYVTGATTYAWDFGDEEISTEENPTHEFEKPGIYTVTLTVNGDGANKFSKKIYVTAEENLLKDGNMEAATGWTITHMDYAAGKPEATLNWNYTDNVPQFGEGGALRVSTTEAYRVIMALSQPVELKGGKSYMFDMAVKTLVAMNSSFWTECYFLGEGITPVAGQKLGLGLGEGSKEYVKETVPANPATQIGGDCSGFINHDAAYNGSIPINWDVKFSNAGFLELNSSASKQPSKVDVGVFTPEKNGTYNFILKIGTQNLMNVVFDELSVRPLFKDLTANPEIQSENISVYVDNNVIRASVGAESTIAIYNVTGLLIESGSFKNQFVSKSLSSGLYIVKLNGSSYKVLVK